jgi:flagellin-like hook-associated protein FlgL
MRVSQALVANIVRQSADRASKSLLAASKPIREGTSVAAPSDNPVAANRLMALDRFERDFERYDKARVQVETDLTSAESTVTTMHDIVTNARDLALAMANDAIDPQTRREMESQAKRYLDQVIAFANRGDASGRYLFTGLAEDQPALTPAGNYLGNDGRRFVTVGPGMEVEATLRGQDVFGTNHEVITSLQDLVTALASGDGDQIRNAIDPLDNGRRILSGARSEIGGRLAMMRDVGELSFSLQNAVKAEKASIDQVDVAAIAPRIATAQASLEAVVQTSQQLMAQIGKSWIS